MFIKAQAIKYMGKISLVTRDDKFPKRMYWGVGPSFMFETDKAEILKEYVIPRDNEKRMDQDALELQFYKDFPAVKGSGHTGWLAPDGTFYPCAYYEHDRASLGIHVTHYGSIGVTRDLEAKGWIRLSYGINLSGIAISQGDMKPTPAQTRAVYDLFMQESNSEIKADLEQSFKYLLAQERDICY